MIWKIDFGDRPWHPWFAWFPVRLTYGMQSDFKVWLHWIEKSTENVQGYRINRYRLPVSKDPCLK